MYTTHTDPSPGPAGLRVLVLGGTMFLGRYLVEHALAAGHEVTLFNRGRSNPGLFADLPTIHGDRNDPADLAQLAGREWDIVIDVAGYTPQAARKAAQALAPCTGRYVFVSTVSVYADRTSPQDEDGKALQLLDGLPEGDGSYGARKAACEQVIGDLLQDRALLPRLGMIFGPHDRSDRFSYWPRRIAAGGRVLVPGTPNDYTQFIDVRDAAAWIITAAAEHRHGAYNITGEPMRLETFIDACTQHTGSAPEFVWSSPSQLGTAGADPTQAPKWASVPGTEGTAPIDVAKAHAAGLRTRPLAETLADVHAWDTARGGPPPEIEALSRSRESAWLTALETRWSARQSYG